MKPVRGALPPRIVQHLATLRRVEDVLRDCLPADCCAHCRPARLEEGTLFLVADSPAWRARLHFYSTRIIRHFNRLGKFPVHRVRVRVARSPEPARSGPARSAPRPIPAATARAFDGLADATDDPALRRALRRLAGHGGADGSGSG